MTDQPQTSMGMDPWERNWMLLSASMLVVFLITVSIAGFAMGIQLTGEDAEVDPTTVLDAAPWSDPGLREIVPGEEYQAYVVAQTWSYVPAVLEVPAGAEVTIFVTSPDLQHGFLLNNTNLNMMVLPGQVSKLTYTFDEVGDYPYICHEYCGTGHANMAGVVRVVDPAEFAASTSEESS
jgi:cytochrome c oxidase subunit 2